MVKARQNVDHIRDYQNFLYVLGVHEEEIQEVKNDLIVPCDEKELNSGLPTFYCFLWNTKKVHAP